MENEKYRNMTISLKVAAEEKIMLRRLAEKYSVTLSEFMYNLVMCFKNQYDYIGMLNPREEKLAENLRLEKKKNVKLSVETENAEFRVKMEIERSDKVIREKDEITFLLKEQKALNVDQLEELKRLTKINQVLKEKNIKLKSISSENHFKNTIFGTAGLFAGFFLRR
jgi:uncharacterized protein YaiL (DUF2058 family)